ncbi:speckle-type POZ protein B-like [Paramacrobiotus metropolitanus]|uniref:speckle-type POZ protein B-like n=1 Tax=Paramacrobiotus metropolitanus TaxID=2943436 RepID=UPI00244569DC|nr:speckle-type POZ protein B-like [Paramacrobiotus metropolitanus]
MVSVIRIDSSGWKQLPLKGEFSFSRTQGFLNGLIQTHNSSDSDCKQQHYSLVQGLCLYAQLVIQLDEPQEAAFYRADLRNLLQSGTLSDCQIVCQGKEFPVHRAILAAQSPVFAAMFQNSMKETSSGICKIDGIPVDLMQIVIQFAYTRAPFQADGKLVELWNVADKYDMQDLCAECVRMMMDSIRAENALAYFDFAREHNFLPLQKAAAKVFWQQS